MIIISYEKEISRLLPSLKVVGRNAHLPTLCMWSGEGLTQAGAHYGAPLL